MFEKPDQIEEKILSIVDPDIAQVFRKPYRGIPYEAVLQMQIARYLKELVTILKGSKDDITDSNKRSN